MAISIGMLKIKPWHFFLLLILLCLHASGSSLRWYSFSMWYCRCEIKTWSSKNGNVAWQKLHCRNNTEFSGKGFICKNKRELLSVAKLHGGCSELWCAAIWPTVVELHDPQLWNCITHSCGTAWIYLSDFFTLYIYQCPELSAIFCAYEQMSEHFGAKMH